MHVVFHRRDGTIQNEYHVHRLIDDNFNWSVRHWMHSETPTSYRKIDVMRIEIHEDDDRRGETHGQTGA